MKLSSDNRGLLFSFALSMTVQAQTGTPHLENFGLQGMRVNALARPSVFGTQNHLYAVADGRCVFRHDLASSNSNWINLGLEEKSFTALDVQVWGIGPAVMQTPIVAVAPDYAGGDSTLIYKLENSQWLPADSGITKEFPLYITALASFATSGYEAQGFAFSGSAEDFLFRSHTRSRHWEWRRGIYAIHTPTIHAIATHQSGDRKEVWIGGDKGMHSFSPMIQKSADFCTTWQELSINLNLGLENTCHAFAFHPHDVDLVYACMLGAVIKSPDGGKTWVVTGLRDKPLSWQFRTLALDSFDPDHLYAGGMNFAGSSWMLWESFDAGETWAEIPPPASALSTDLGITDIVPDPITSGVIYIATIGDGVWKYSGRTVAVHEPNLEPPSQTYVLEQNYPNPFNASTEIRYQIPFAQSIELAVYDTKGRLMRMLFDGFQVAGMHKSKWDGRDRRGRPAASGIYFYRLKAGTSFVLSHKLVLSQ